MSAVSAIYLFRHHSLLKEHLHSIHSAMSHHRQEGGDIWIDINCGLAQQTTHLTKESFHECYPYCDPYRQLALVMHGRLFNRKELSQQLHVDLKINCLGDGELILRAYVKWQHEFVSYLVGEWSFILWDQKKQHLIAVSDHFNSQPLYYYKDAERIVFATEIAALHCLPFVPRQPNLNKIARHDFMRYQSVPGETVFKNVHLLPAASMMVTDSGGACIKTYWQPGLGKPILFKNDHEFISGFQEIFGEAVISSTRSHLPVCLQLSGGLDSSSIAMMANHHLKEIICLSNVLPSHYQGKATDEREFIGAVAGAYLKKEEVVDEWCGPFDDLNSCKKDLRILSQYYQYCAINERARQHKSSIILHGTLAELSASYYSQEYLAELFSGLHLLKLYRELAAYKKVHPYSSLGAIARHVIKPFLPVWIQKQFAKSNYTDLITHSFINKSFIQAHLTSETYESIITQLTHMAASQSVDAKKNMLTRLN